MNELLLKSILKETSSFPDNKELLVLRGMMDGKSFSDIASELKITIKEVKSILTEGMKKSNVKNLYELIVWGLRSGIIKDTPINIDREVRASEDGYPAWLLVLNFIVLGYNTDEISREAHLSRESIKYYRDYIVKKFRLGNSIAELIRFSFQALNPITPPTASKIVKPFRSVELPKSKYPIVLTKFRPADIDANIPVHDRSISRNLPDQGEKLPYIPRLKRDPNIKFTPPIIKTTPIQTALYLLGVDKRALYAPAGLKRGEGIFWKKPPERLWDLLALAKRRYELEIAHAHPDRGGDAKRAAQLHSAWNLVKKLFAKRGFTLGR